MSDTLVQTSGDAKLLSEMKADAGQNSIKGEAAHPECAAIFWEALRLVLSTQHNENRHK